VEESGDVFHGILLSPGDASAGGLTGYERENIVLVSRVPLRSGQVLSITRWRGESRTQMGILDFSGITIIVILRSRTQETFHEQKDDA